MTRKHDKADDKTIKPTRTHHNVREHNREEKKRRQEKMRINLEKTRVVTNRE